MTHPGPLIGDRLVRIGQHSGNLFLELRRHLRNGWGVDGRRSSCHGRFLVDEGTTQHDVHVEKLLSVQRFRHVVAGLVHKAAFFFGEGRAFLASNDKKAVHPTAVLQGDSEQGLRPRRHHPQAHGATSVLILRGYRGDRGCGQRAQDGLNIARREASGGVTDERTVFAVKDGGQRRIHWQIIEDRSERPVKLGFPGRFTVRSRRRHLWLLPQKCAHCSNGVRSIQRKVLTPLDGLKVIRAD